jgi:arylsulfatase A-like enzyme
LENTWLILTSDHGELFERGLSGHVTEMLFQPVIHVPLLIFEPGRTSRLDIFDKTSNIDILPTLLHITNQEIPDWLEGKLLPPYEDVPENERDVFAFESKITERNEPIRGGTAALVRGDYKLVYYFGYEELGESREMIELYDINNDPDELENLYSSQKAIADELLAVVQSKISTANQPYH